MFYFGKAPVVFVLLFLLTFPVILFRSNDESNTLEFWVFAQTHYDEFNSRIPAFEAANPGIKVDIRLVPVTNYDDKLLAAFLSEIGAPDIAAVEISSVGRFFKGRKEDIGFVDLTQRLEVDGLMDEFVKERLAPWSLNDRVYGVPHDVHPVVFLYRNDVYKKLGIDPDSIRTWEDFIHVGRRIKSYQGATDSQIRYPLMLSGHKTGHFWLMLLQNGGGMFDKNGKVIIDNEISISTLEFYCRLLNEEMLAIPEFSQDPANFAAMKEGVVLGILAPDWYIGALRKFVPELSGKWRAMPLPVWREGGRRTSTWGGTMYGITKQCKNIELAWSFIRHICTGDETFANRFRKTTIIPPMQSAWTNPIFSVEDPYFGGQALGRMLTDLGNEVPTFHLNPFWAEGADLLRQAVYEAVQNIKTPEEALSHLAEQLRKLMEETARTNRIRN